MATSVAERASTVKPQETQAPRETAFLAGEATVSGEGWSNYGYRDYAPMAMRFTTSDPIRSGANWYAYVGGDPVNYVDPWGLEASDSAATSLDPGDVITAANPLDQLEFEARHGYGNGVTPGVSCQTVAMINAYACDGGVQVSDLDRAVDAWEARGEIVTTGAYAGSVGNWTPMSQTLATELGRDTYLEFRYPSGTLERVSEAEFGTSGAGMGIAYEWNADQRTQHWVLMTLTQTIDSLDPQRATAGGYEVRYVQPLQTLRLP
jgi:RHS repeat-associated protein